MVSPSEASPLGSCFLSRVFLIAMVPTDERAVNKESPQGD
jgi:hypothetical protein